MVREEMVAENYFDDDSEDDIEENISANESDIVKTIERNNEVEEINKQYDVIFGCNKQYERTSKIHHNINSVILKPS